MVCASCRGLPVPVQAVPLLGGDPKAGGDLGRVDAVQVLLDGRQLPFLLFLLGEGVYRWAW